MALFERAARPGETLPAGEPRIVANQAAVLQRSGQILTLTWISAGTWLELEGRLPEAELLKVAEGLTVSQTPDATSADATPAGVQSTFFEIPRLSVDEAQKQVSFHIPVLTWLPPGFKLGGAHVMPPDWANTFYVPTDPVLAAAYAGMGVSIKWGKDTTGYSITGAQVQEEIMVNGHPAQYMAGPSVGMLMWEADGFSYNLTYGGFALSREDVKRLAESLR
jgi:hypothetical protein